jgi:hypothetical protein
LKFLTNKLGPIVKDNSGWLGVPAQPIAIEQKGDMVAGFVAYRNEFWPPSGFINVGEGMDLLNGAFPWDVL